MNYAAGIFVIAAAGAIGTVAVVVFSAGALKATIEVQLADFSRRLTEVEETLKAIGVLAPGRGGPHGHR